MTVAEGMPTSGGAEGEGGRVRLRQDAIALGVLALVPLLKFLTVTLGTGVFSGGDHAWINLPLKAVTRSAFEQGAIPLWNKALSCGTPHLAQGEAGVFYLGTLLIYTPIDLLRAYGWTMLGHIVLLGWATYALIRSHRCRPSIAAIFAGLMMLAPYVLFNLPTSNVVQAFWSIPVVFLCGEWARRGSPLTAGATGGLVLAQQLMLGRPAILVYVWMTLGVVAAAQIILAERPWRVTARMATFAGVALALGVAVAAIQLAPTLEFLPLSSRGGGLESDFTEAGGWLRVTRLFALFLFPTFPMDPGRYAAYHTSNPYLGIVPLALMLLALMGVASRRARILPLAVGAGFSLALAIGPGVPVVRALWAVPPFSLLRYPGRALPVFLCLGFLLAALAWESMVHEGRRPGRTRMLVVSVAIASGLMAFALQAGEVVSPAVALSQLALQIVPIAVVMAWPALRARKKAWNLALVTCCAVQAAPLFFFYGEFVQTRAEFDQALSPFSVLESFPPGERGMAVGGMQPFGSQRLNPPTLGNGATLGGAQVINEFNQFTWGSWRTFMRRTLHRYGTGREPLPPSPALCDLLGIRWLYSHGSRTFDDPAWLEVGGDRTLILWRRIDGVGRASFADRVVRRPPPGVEDMVDVIREGAIDFESTVLLEDPEAPEADQGAGPVTARVREEASGPNVYRFEVETPSAGYLVVRDHDAPGWGARVDDVAVAHYRANGWFKAVWVPEGNHRVEFVYRPESFRLGATTSLVGCGAAIVLLGTCFGLRRRRGVFP
jgi:hypothetical protein